MPHQTARCNRRNRSLTSSLTPKVWWPRNLNSEKKTRPPIGLLAGIPSHYLAVPVRLHRRYRCVSNAVVLLAFEALFNFSDLTFTVPALIEFIFFCPERLARGMLHEVMQRRETSQTILGERAVAFPRLRHAEPPAVKMIGYVVKSTTAPTP